MWRGQVDCGDARRERRPEVSDPVKSSERDGQALQVVVFRLGQTWLAWPVSALDEVATVRAIQPVPHRRGAQLKGVGNVRGVLLPCVNLSSVLQIAAHAGTTEDAARAQARGRLLVLTSAKGKIMVEVDEVDAVQTVRLDALDVQAAHEGEGVGAYLMGWRTDGMRRIGLLDHRRVHAALERAMQ